MLLETDLAVLRLMRTRGHNRQLERAITVYSRSGEHAACWFALGVAGLLVERRGEVQQAQWRRGLAVVGAAYGVNYAVKITVRRRRPQLPELPPLSPVVSSLSFPSAHSTTSFAAARAFSAVMPGPILYTAAAAFALSRPYLGVHYPSDVLAGAALGTLVAGAWPR
ncbi:MAG: phosphatase PAP2 family protein [Solirubrobacteraceae bacterium]